MNARTAKVLLQAYYAYMLEYRSELILWMLAGSMPFIMMGLWMKAAASGLFAQSPVDMARYFISVFVVRQLTLVWVIYDFERELIEGKLSPMLLQPMDPVWRHFVSHVSERFARLPFVVLVLLVFGLLMPEAIWIPSFASLALAMGASFLAFLLRFIMQHTGAMLTFWTERAASIESFWFLMYMFFSGVIAPLSLMPEGLQAVISWTPFPYLVHFPAMLLMGEDVDLVKSLGVMGGWGLLYWIVNRQLWKHGLKRYSGMGA